MSFVNGIVNHKLDILEQNNRVGKPSHYWITKSLKIDGIGHIKESLEGLYRPLPWSGSKHTDKDRNSQEWSRDVYVVFELNIGLWHRRSVAPSVYGVV